MFVVKLLANSAVICIYYIYTAVITLCFEHAEHFHISYFTHHFRCYIITDHSWKLLTMSERVLSN